MGTNMATYNMGTNMGTYIQYQYGYLSVPLLEPNTMQPLFFFFCNGTILVLLQKTQVTMVAKYMKSATELEAAIALETLKSMKKHI